MPRFLTKKRDLPAQAESAGAEAILHGYPPISGPPFFTRSPPRPTAEKPKRNHLLGTKHFCFDPEMWELLEMALLETLVGITKKRPPLVSHLSRPFRPVTEFLMLTDAATPPIFKD